MTKQELIEIWNAEAPHQVVSNSIINDYILGDDSQKDNLPKFKEWYYVYPDRIVDEVDGEQGDMAKRMLYALTLMCDRGILDNHKEDSFYVFYKAGYSL